jgi:hypothetical protein
VFIQPLADDPIGLLGFLPEKSVAATVDHLELSTFNMIAEIFRCRHVIARVGINSILAADQAQSRSRNLVQIFAGLMLIAGDDVPQVGFDFRRIVPKSFEELR